MPTRITSRSASLIDHIYYLQGTKTKDCISVKSGNFLEDITNHLPTYTCMLLINNRKKMISPRPTVRIFSEKNMSLFKS